MALMAESDQHAPTPIAPTYKVNPSLAVEHMQSDHRHQ
jgi:hypothetical protein